MVQRYTWKTLLLEIAMLLGALITLFPIALVFLNSVKDNREITMNLFSLPTEWHLENFTVAWDRMHYGTAFINTVIVTVSSVAGIILCASMASYKIVRVKCAFSAGMLGMLLFFIASPVQVLMVPMVIVSSKVGLANSRAGVVLMYVGFFLPMAIFLYRGFIKNVPLELEEAALIDGCGPYNCFFRVVFPILKPITATILIIDAIAIFNDFMIPLVMINKQSLRTIQLAIKMFFDSYLKEWNYVMAALTLTVGPMIVFFLLMQKRIMRGMMDGAIKG